MITLITNYYVAKTDDRRKEIDFCLEQNNKLNVNLTCVGSCQPPFGKWIRNKDRPTYGDLFGIGNNIMGIKVIANSDIYFDDTIWLLKEIIKNGTALCLTRYEFKDGNWIRPPYCHECQDSWGWRDKVEFKSVPDYHMGSPGCDNAIAYQLAEIGLKLINPMSRIKSYHMHKSEEKNYLPRVKGKYEFIHPDQ